MLPFPSTKQLVARARKKADALGKSLNQLIRDYLQTLAGVDDPERSIAEFKRLSGKGHSRGCTSIGTKFTRARRCQLVVSSTPTFCSTPTTKPVPQNRRPLLRWSQSIGALDGCGLDASTPRIFRVSHTEIRRRRAIARRKVELLAELTSPHRTSGLFWVRSICIACTAFLSGTRLVLRTAKQSGCTVLLSEDMQDRREIDGVRIVNPFG